MTSRRTSSYEDQQKIKELEEQVADYKRRLDELRRAKNTTVLKREQKFVEVGAPSMGRRLCSVCEGKLSDEPNSKQGKSIHDNQTGAPPPAAVTNHSTATQQPQQNTCDHEEEIRALRKKLEEVLDNNAVLVAENEELSDRVSSLTQELSVKEAKWCETEEKFKLELQSQWGDKYREWMSEMERKVHSLQQTNTMLQEMLNRSRPEGQDPTRQDK